ncbi:MAG: type II toxin-antitoxin system RelE/ParE family toxin [Gemmatimonadetes bacterium]|nr:type II toxin-antitoxin system RelE/ParE family toxin [Gemmatimonadota bacterium]
MASYKLLIKPSAAKEVESLPLRERRRIVARIQRLATEPRPPGCQKLSGEEKYRVRQGDYRVVYGMDDAKKELLVVKIGHRGDVYQ